MSMFNKIKNYFLKDVLSQELDTIELANVTVVFYVVMLALALLLPLQLLYLFSGNFTQLYIGILSLSVFGFALVFIKIKQKIDLVAHGIMVFSTFICCLNIFMYPNAEFSNALLLCCNIIFAFNFFKRKTGFVYSSIHLLAPIIYLLALENKVDTSFITPINQPVGEKVATIILLFTILLVIINHYQTAHKNAAKRLNAVIDDLKTSEDQRKKSQKIGKIGNWSYNIQTKQINFEEETCDILGIAPTSDSPLEAMLSCLNESDRQYLIQILQLDKSITKIDFEPEITRADGDTRTVSIFGEPQYDKTGQPIRYLGIIQDITERKKIAIEQKKLLDITSFQNSKLKNFAYIVSHNIRSHSANITSLVDFLEHVKSEEERVKIMDMLKRTANNLDGTLQNLNNIITITENYSKPKVTVILKDEVQKTLDVLSGVIYQHQIEIAINVADHISIPVISSYCESILLNVISNAIKYRTNQRPPRIEIHAELTEEFCVLSIKDNGKGIDLAKHGSKLFGMYKTFHENEDARGIGLFITKNHIEAMKGKIEVESEVNVGTTFKIFFNLYD